MFDNTVQIITAMKKMATPEKLSAGDNKTTRWIGKDALRELTSEKIQKRLRKTR